MSFACCYLRARRHPPAYKIEGLDDLPWPLFGPMSVARCLRASNTHRRMALLNSKNGAAESSPGAIAARRSAHHLRRMAGQRKARQTGGRWRPTEVHEYAELISACSHHDRAFVLHLAKAAIASVPQDIELLVLDLLHESLLGGTISQMKISISKPRWWIRRRLIAQCGVSPQERCYWFSAVWLANGCSLSTDVHAARPPEKSA